MGRYLCGMSGEQLQNEPVDPEENLDTPEFRSLLNKSFEEARQRTWATGLPVTAAKDGYIVRIYADGTVEQVKKVDLQPEFNPAHTAELEKVLIGLGLGLFLGVVIESLQKK